MEFKVKEDLPFKLYSSLELLMLIAIRVKCFDAALQFWIYRHIGNFVLTFSAKFQDKTWRRYPQAAGRQRRQNFVNS